MRKIIENKKVHYLIVLGAVAFGVYAFFVASPTGQAVANAEIGNITGVLIPSPVLSGTESVSITFDSNSGAGQLDISGWTVIDGAGFSHSFAAGTVLNEGSTFKVCADQTKESTCDAEWSGGDSWANAGDFILKDASGQTKFAQGYSVSAGSGQTVTSIYTLVAPVYVHNDKIMICHEDNKGAMGAKSVPVGPLLKGDTADRGHADHVGDIVPPFYYNIGSGVEFYAGKLWPAGKATYDAGCI